MKTVMIANILIKTVFVVCVTVLAITLQIQGPHSPMGTWQLRGAEEGRTGEGFSWGPGVDTALARGHGPGAWAGSSDGSATDSSYSGLSEGFLRL